MSTDVERALAHSWAYFEMHAAQRITIFNYFVVFSGVLTTGLAASIQATPRLASVGIAIGLLLALLSYVFWQLDRRTSFLVKHAEAAIAALEPAGATLITDEISKSAAAKSKDGIWTYGDAFRMIFATMAAVGLAGALVCGLRFAGGFTWETDVSHRAKNAVSVADVLPRTNTAQAGAGSEETGCARAVMVQPTNPAPAENGGNRPPEAVAQR